MAKEKLEKFYAELDEEFKELNNLIMSMAIELQNIAEAEKEMDETLVDIHKSYAEKLVEQINEELIKHDPEKVQQFLQKRKVAWSDIKEADNVEGVGTVLRCDVPYEVLATIKTEQYLQKLISNSASK